jgi:hypothetical protein
VTLGVVQEAVHCDSRWMVLSNQEMPDYLPQFDPRLPVTFSIEVEPSVMEELEAAVKAEKGGIIRGAVREAAKEGGGERRGVSEQTWGAVWRS